MAKVLVYLPSYDGFYHDQIINATFLLREDPRYEVTIYFTTKRPVSNALNDAFAVAREQEFDYLLIMDYDNPPQKNPLDLILYNKDIITMATPIFNANAISKGAFPIYWNGFMYDKEKDGYAPVEFPKNTELPVKVDAVGAGCLLIHKRVFTHPDMLNYPFERKTKEDGTTYRGPDLIFCEKARDAGFTCWIHYGYLCNHIKQVGLFEVMDAVAMERDATIRMYKRGELDKAIHSLQPDGDYGRDGSPTNDGHQTPSPEHNSPGS